MADVDPAVGALTAASIAAGMDKIRFDKSIQSFEFKPSLGIVAKQLQMFGAEFKDMREPLKKAVTDVMQYSILENFMTGGRPEKWDDLTYYTIRRRKGKALPVLVWTGALAEGASSPSIWSIGSATATVRDLPQKIWYGKVHQAGAAGDDSLGAGNWFDKYKKAAAKIEGPEASDDEITKTAYKIFDARVTKHGIAPQATADIPARPFILFQEEDLDAIQLIFAQWIEEKARSVGRFV
jgi:phage gpG-like protein